jgi:Tol biopolymer transport system component
VDPCAVVAVRALRAVSGRLPSGLRIAFASERDTPDDTDIYTMRATGDEVRRVTSAFGDDGTPRWSPDSTRLVFVSWRYRQADLMLISADGTDERVLTDGLENDYVPRWLPAEP